MTGANMAARERLARQGIEDPRAETPLDVVRHLGALQAQDYPSALWAIGLRLAQPSLHSVEQAVAARQIVRTWPLRGTLQIAPAEDVRWMLALTAERVIARAERRREALALTPRELVRAERVLEKALADGPLARDQVMAVLDRGKVSTAGQRGYHILFQLSLRGVICFGPQQGKQLTVALLDAWAPQRRSLAQDEALAELATRYFQSRSPATDQDFAWWAGLTLREARNGRALARLVPLARRTAPRSLHLLPAFDEYLLGYRDRTAVLSPEHAARIVPGSNGVFLPTVVESGRVIGTWKRSVTKRAARLEVSAFAPITAATRKAIDRAGERYGAFMNLPVAISLG